MFHLEQNASPLNLETCLCLCFIIDTTCFSIIQIHKFINYDLFRLCVCNNFFVKAKQCNKLPILC